MGREGDVGQHIGFALVHQPVRLWPAVAERGAKFFLVLGHYYLNRADNVRAEAKAQRLLRGESVHLGSATSELYTSFSFIQMRAVASAVVARW